MAMFIANGIKLPKCMYVLRLFIQMFFINNPNYPAKLPLIFYIFALKYYFRFYVIMIRNVTFFKKT